MKKFGLLAAALLAWPASRALPADFDGDSHDDPTVMRVSDFLWAVMGVTRFYFGSNYDYLVPGDYNGDGIDEAAIFRPSTGMWSARGVTRFYFGSSATMPIMGGGGRKTYDYIVRPDNSADLVQALESNAYASVFIPAGTYYVNDTIHVDNVRRIQAEDPGFTTIQFGAGAFLSIESAYCAIDGLTVNYGGSAAQAKGNFYIASSVVSVSNCASLNSADDGFEYTASSFAVSFVNCRAAAATYAGFRSAFGSSKTSRLTNCLTDHGLDGFVECRNLSSCVAFGALQYGFSGCWNLSACSTDGDGHTVSGFYQCQNLAGCNAYDASTAGFDTCSQLSGCRADGAGRATYGFAVCWYLSSCYSYNAASADFAACHELDGDSCND